MRCGLLVRQRSASERVPASSYKFGDKYQFLYDNYDNVTGYDEALDAGEEFIRNHPNFAKEFVQYRYDALTSDREVAAFAFALSSYGAI